MSSSQPAAVAKSPSDKEIEEKFDLGIWHALFNWPNLTVAIQNQWGGPNSSDKRDWFAGAISEQFERDPETNAEDVGAMLLQVMEDEFTARVEDNTEEAVAEQIMKMRKETKDGNYATVDALQARWLERQGRPVATGNVNVTQVDQDAEWDSVDEESGSEDTDGDVDMSEASPAAPPKPKPEPEVDEEGFTKVVGKRRH